jgi:hypothetical protein
MDYVRSGLVAAGRCAIVTAPICSSPERASDTNSRSALVFDRKNKLGDKQAGRESALAAAQYAAFWRNRRQRSTRGYGISQAHDGLFSYWLKANLRHDAGFDPFRYEKFLAMPRREREQMKPRLEAVAIDPCAVRQCHRHESELAGRFRYYRAIGAQFIR